MSSRSWYYQLFGDVVGPLTAREMQVHVGMGRINRDTLVREGENGDWVLADHICSLLETGEGDDFFTLDRKPVSDTLREAVQVAASRSFSDDQFGAGMADAGKV